MKTVPPRGMRDFLPAEKRRRERLMELIRRSYLEHGFSEIETPALENIERLTSGVGSENEKLAFRVMRRALTAEQCHQGPEGLADLGLRFDLTIPLVRFWNSNRGVLPPVFRAVQMGPVWRAERPQKGRYRQFIQCDIDIIGQAEVAAEVELLLATLSTLHRIGVARPVLRINDRRILAAMLAALEVPVAAQPEVLIALDKLDKIGAEAVSQELASFPKMVAYLAAASSEATAGSETASASAGFTAELTAAVFAVDKVSESAAANIQSVITRLLPPDTQAAEAVGELARIVTAVAPTAPAEIVFDPFLVRGMGYYTGPIFEILHPEHGYSLAGGGRYDGLIERMGGPATPACGFSIGFERVLDLLAEQDPADENKLLLLYEAGADLPALAALKLRLIRAGCQVRMEAAARNRRAQNEQAYREGYRALLWADAETCAETEPQALLARAKPLSG